MLTALFALSAMPAKELITDAVSSAICWSTLNASYAAVCLNGFRSALILNNSFFFLISVLFFAPAPIIEEYSMSSAGFQVESSLSTASLLVTGSTILVLLVSKPKVANINKRLSLRGSTIIGTVPYICSALLTLSILPRGPNFFVISLTPSAVSPSNLPDPSGP